MRIEERVAHFGVALSAIHGDVGLFEQRLVVAAEGDPDARARIERRGAGLERPADLREQPLRDRDRVVRRHGLRQDDGELVAAEAGCRVSGPHRVLDALADLAQHRVAEVVSPAVVDPLEVVEVDVEQPGRVPLIVPQLDGVLEPLVEEGAVRQPGQRVVEGELP